MNPEFKSRALKGAGILLLASALAFGACKFYERNLSTDAFGKSASDWFDTYFPIEKPKY
jgi:hypothetical protein